MNSGLKGASVWILFVAVSLLLQGCATTGKKPETVAAAPVKQVQIKPDWLAGGSQSHPDSLYLTGVGSGTSVKAAQDSAYAAVSLIFRADVASRTGVHERYTDTSTGGRSKATKNVRLEKDTTVSTDKILKDINIAAMWQDESDGMQYALAVLERRHAAASVREEIAAIDADLSALYSEAKKSDDKIVSVRRLLRMKPILQQREAYNADLRTIESSGRGIDAPYSIEGIESEVDQLIANDIHIGLKLNGPGSDSVASAMREALTRAGFAVQPGTSRQQRDIFIDGDIALEQVETPSWKFARWTIQLDLHNLRTGKIFGSVQRNGREGHINFAEAERKALRKMRKQVVGEISSILREFILGEDRQASSRSHRY